MRIAISGAGIAGCTLAYWLLKAGHEPVLIEQAPQFRAGGYVVDFWGLGYQIARNMGLEVTLQERGYKPGEVRFVDAQGNKAGGFSTREVAGDFVSIQRGALAQTIFETIRDRAEVRFGQRMVAIEESSSGVMVSFADGATESFDLVIGADGLHSGVRDLCFGPEDSFERFMGFAVAAFEADGYYPRDESVYLIYPTPSHQVARFAMHGDRTLFLLVFRTDPSQAAAELSPAQVRELVTQEFAGQGWEIPAILDAMGKTDALYFDRMSQIVMPQWHKGRVALLGDAAAAVSLLAGEGTGLAMTEAYVLAGELHKANGDYPAAFAAYESNLRPFLEQKQKSARNFASSFVPKSDLGIWLRNQATKLMGIPGVSGLLLSASLSDDFELPEYDFG